ncbi:hypothetical protein CASFOL_005728 [Castilleja foliolosa]|uniref:IQ domain-containing protein IQM2-like n=1 Tax=Castilleja foliolosa TaxID=1961234 RepID=A0ABD3E497_9LAMI
MGLSRSCPPSVYFDLENGFESIVKSSGLQNDELRSVGLKPKSSEPKIMQSSGSRKFLEGSFRFRSRKPQTMKLIETQTGDDKIIRQDTFTPNDEAAIKLQKVYKSFRTRRKLADCAVLIEQSWWKLLDFAELKHSSISFFDIEKHETAFSRWSRARTRAAKVGKGLSENGKARKLALQHWLEAIDPRHRYGHNLHFYYMNWLNSQSKEPFFYWLDIGEGKEVSLTEKCSRSKLQEQCIKYIGPMERKVYEVTVDNGKLIYKETGELLNTVDEPKGCKWIFVLSTSRTLYVGKKKKGSFQHSSFLAGGATLAAGRIVAENGVLKAVWPHSGHYRPTPENFQDFLSFLKDNVVDLTDVKLDSTDEEDSLSSVGKHVRRHSSGDDMDEKDRPDIEKIESSKKFDAKRTLIKLKSFTIPSEETKEDETISEKYINSHKGTKSFQLGKQLSSKWSTGAGPRIGCVRDYPTGLQSDALEKVNLSPRSKHCRRFEFGSTKTGSNLWRSGRTSFGGRDQGD